MSLNDAVSEAAAKRLSAVDLNDFVLLMQLASLGFSPAELHAGLARVASSEVVPLPPNLGSARVLQVNAWSFVHDAGQYHDAYGLTDEEAGRLKGLLKHDMEKGVAEITALVTGSLAQRGSPRPVKVSLEGMPGIDKAAHHALPGRQRGADLKAEIARNAGVYGMYGFTPEDTGRPGHQRFRVALGAGLYAVYPSKTGAVDVAKICRVNGRDFPLIAGRVVFWREGKPPLSGPDIPDKVKFDGILKPFEPMPPNPVEKDKTTASPSRAET